MDLERTFNSSHSSKDIVSQIKRLITVLAFITFLVLEIYACYSISHAHSNQLNTHNFSCNTNIDIGNNLHVNICNKLVNIIQHLNNTVASVTLSDTEWFTLSQLLR
jgi:hypothetical protein